MSKETQLILSVSDHGRREIKRIVSYLGTLCTRSLLLPYWASFTSILGLSYVDSRLRLVVH